jgi:hypothetical protein
VLEEEAGEDDKEQLARMIATKTAATSFGLMDGPYAAVVSSMWRR